VVVVVVVGVVGFSPGLWLTFDDVGPCSGDIFGIFAVIEMFFGGRKKRTLKILEHRKMIQCCMVCDEFPGF